MTFLANNNSKTVYGASTKDSSFESESYSGSPLNTMNLPLKTNDPVRRKLHPWFEDFEFYKFGDSYIIYYTGDKDEIYVAVADLFTFQMLLINVNLDHVKMIKKSKKYVRQPEREWKIVAAYCMTYGHKVTKKIASDMTFFMNRLKEKEIQIIAPYWRKEAQEMSERPDQREKERLQDEIDELRKDRDKWRERYGKAEYEEEARQRLEREMSSLPKSKKKVRNVQVSPTRSHSERVG
jgi:hypothetical protein